jgi:hypothetical protein
MPAGLLSRSLPPGNARGALACVHLYLHNKSQAGGPGLLAQALKLPGGTSLPRPLTLRAVSLSNLLDVGMTGLDQLISQPSGDPQGGAAQAQSAAAAQDHGRQQQHHDYEVDSQVGRRERGLGPGGMNCLVCCK